MANSARTRILALLFWLIAADPARASQLEDGQVAFARGDYAGAFEIWRPLAIAAYDSGDYTTAAKIMLPLGEAGYPLAERDLGRMYDCGFCLWGGEDRETKAYMWLTLSIANSPTEDAENLGIALRLRDEVAAKMSPAEIVRAQELASHWRPTVPLEQIAGAPASVTPLESERKESSTPLVKSPQGSHAEADIGNPFAKYGPRPSGPATENPFDAIDYHLHTRSSGDGPLRLGIVLGLVSMISIVVFAALRGPEGESAVLSTKQTLSRYWNKLSRALIYRLLFTFLVAATSAIEALNRTMNPMTPQEKSDLYWHPLAAIAGSLTPTLILAPAIYWLSGSVYNRIKLRYKVCAYCAETIKSQAQVCRHCGREVAPAANESLLISNESLLISSAPMANHRN